MKKLLVLFLITISTTSFANTFPNDVIRILKKNFPTATVHKTGYDYKDLEKIVAQNEEYGCFETDVDDFLLNLEISFHLREEVKDLLEGIFTDQRFISNFVDETFLCSFVWSTMPRDAYTAMILLRDGQFISVFMEI